MRMRLTVERHRYAGPGVKHHHPHRGRVNEGLQVGSGAPLLPMLAGVGDDQGRLGGEHAPGYLLVLLALNFRSSAVRVGQHR